MKNGINLASHKTVAKKKVKYSSFAMAFFLGTFVIAVVLIAVNVFFRMSLSNLANEETALTNSINSQSAKKIKYLALQERLSAINNVIKSRQDINGRLKQLLSIFPEELTFTKLEADNEKIGISVETANLQMMDTLISRNIPAYGQDKNNGLRTVNLLSLVAGQNVGFYNATFEFNY